MKVATGEEWDYVIRDFWGDPESCSKNAEYQGIINGTETKCGSRISLPFFILFLVITKLLVLNSFLAIIIEGYSKSKI